MRRELCNLLVPPLLMVGACAYLEDPPLTEPPWPPDRRVTVYEIVGHEGHLRLERAKVAVPATGNAAKDAVRGLLGHQPRKRGHDSLWAGRCAPGAGVKSVNVTKGLVTVRLREFAPDEPGDALCDLTWEGWRMQKQQVAWTVRTATESRAPVRVIVGAHYRWMPRTRAHASALAQSAN